MPTLGKNITCAFCGKAFIYGEGKSKTSKFCSDFCYNEHNKNMYKQVCKTCGKEFSRQRLANGRLSRMQYCSKQCELDRYKRERDKEKKYQICKQCGKSFELHRITNNSWSKELFCSDDCFRQNYFERTKNSFKQTCRYCGKEFVRQRLKDNRLSRSIYCSDICAIKGQSKNYNKACQEKYGVSYNCLLPQCQSAW